MPSLQSSANARPARGLTARAVLFTTLLIVATAVLASAIVFAGAQREGERQQFAIASDLTEHFAVRAGDFVARGNVSALQRMMGGAVERREASALSVRDTGGRVLAHAGGDAGEGALMASLAGRAMASRATVPLRSSAGALAVAAPILRDGRVTGAVVRVWAPGGAYGFDMAPTLVRLLLFLGCLVLAVALLTAHAVRRATAPLYRLVHFAQQMARQGWADPIDLHTGDEFETLANALNAMTSRLEAQAHQIQDIAFIDPATGLPNQERFVREIDFFMVQNDAPATGAVVVCELERLPKLMQTFDPHAARDVLRVVAERLTSVVRTIDPQGRGANPPVAARLGTAEFAVFIPGASQAEAARYAQHLNAALNEPFVWRGHTLTLGACCGVALALRDGGDADAVIRHARMALGAAHTAPSRVRMFTQSLDREAVARLMLEREMHAALERNEFRAYFQPKMNLVTGRVEACEALARWVRPDGAVVDPSRFIAVAEESGLIHPLSDAIVREACWKAAAWARAGHPTKVAVNVSALQFRSERFADNVLRMVQLAGLAPNHLELEITESAVMADPERALRVIQPLRAAGVRLAIDDFGRGHSSLAALSKLPFDVIKIDRHFVRSLARGDAQSAAIVEMILALARTLGMEVVAEGLERREDMEFMAARGCRWGQGFLFGEAVSADEFTELLRRQAGEAILDAA